MQYTSVDPGKNTGWAVWGEGPILLECGLAQEDGSPKYPPLRGRPGLFLVEIPQVYTAQKSDGDPNDLIAVAVLAGQYRERFLAAGARVGGVLPREWKGTISKEMCNARTKITIERMGGASLENYKKHTARIAPTLLNNTLDAVGLGLAAFTKGLWPR